MTTPDGGQYDPSWNPNQNPQQTAIAQDPKNGMGIAALVFGVLALLSIVIVWIPFVGILTIVIALLAIIFGVIGRRRAKSLQATNGGVALIGLILGVLMFLLGLVLQILLIVFSVAFINSGGGAALQQAQQCVAQAQQQPNPAAVQQAIEQCGQQFGSQMPSLGG